MTTLTSIALVVFYVAGFACAVWVLINFARWIHR